MGCTPRVLALTSTRVSVSENLGTQSSRTRCPAGPAGAPRAEQPRRRAPCRLRADSCGQTCVDARLELRLVASKQDVRRLLEEERIICGVRIAAERVWRRGHQVAPLQYGLENTQPVFLLAILVNVVYILP